MAEIQDKTREWSERFGSILRLSAETQFSHLYKGAAGGLEHVISVDNGGSYMEMWRDGGDQYYATTGAAIKPLPGLAKGARLDEALDRFFVLMTKVEKARDARPARDDGQRPQRKAIPKKIKRLAGVRKERRIDPTWSATEGNRTVDYERKKPPVKKNIVEKVDPEIGPSMSVGHRKPSDLSPESSMRKMARLIVNNVVALTGNQPGSGRVKPEPKPAPKSDYKSPQGFSGRRMGTPGAPGASHSGMVQQDAMGRKTGSRRSKPDFGRMQSKHEDRQGSTAHHKQQYGGHAPPARERALVQRLSRLSVPEKHQLRIARDTLKMSDAGARIMGGPSKQEAKEIIKRLLYGKGGRKESKENLRRPGVHTMTGGRTQPGGGTKPVKPAMGDPGQPTSYGSTGQPQYRYERKACLCDEVAKTVRAVSKQEPSKWTKFHGAGLDMPSRRPGASTKPFPKKPVPGGMSHQPGQQHVTYTPPKPKSPNYQRPPGGHGAV